MSGKYILNAEGQPEQCADLTAWARWMEQADDARRVAFTHTANGDVSTVFLGLDHRFGAGAPLLFETMVFGGPLADESDRYSTREEARAGHAVMVARVLEMVAK